MKGYNIKYGNDNEQTQTVPKWDFGGDKPWTNSIWNKIIKSLEELDHSNYPLIISDLDNVNEKELILENKNELEEWMKNAFK
ncbi:hypothetical protein H3Z83_02920 [Tenacibaculum sp. S7007]|uniref:Uncharacterized protein n=1 Tax=Tenacibaculum pelagium TaxID=2759527 RepID=A0A839AM20_9FLAO|nr:hypothetical protein [Tenacibaculum pelagium]